MNKNDLFYIVLPAVAIILVLVVYFLLTGQRRQRIDQRIARVTRRKSTTRKASDVLTLRKAKDQGIPVIGKLLQSMMSLSTLTARLERAGLTITPDKYIAACAGICVFLIVGMLLAHKPLPLALAAAFMFGIVLPYVYIGMKGGRRLKKFLLLFPDAIDFIVRGLRSGLPATESMNMVGTEMEDPIAGIFASIGESVRLGVSVEKALGDTAKKLKLTEFNFFVTSIVLQRETGGNLSEILSNLSDVLRKRFMMRMKIKAMSSEAKASAIIVGSLPFVVILALMFISPNYLDPLWYDGRGHIAAGVAATMMAVGIGIMIKMTKFEI